MQYWVNVDKIMNHYYCGGDLSSGVDMVVLVNQLHFLLLQGPVWKIHILSSSLPRSFTEMGC